MTGIAEGVRTNVVQSFGALAQGRGLTPVPRDLIIVDDQDGLRGLSTAPLLYTMALLPIRPLPWFFRSDDGAIDSPQRPLFGLYVLRAAWRGCFIGARFLQAGDLLQGRQFLAAAIVCHYTASFHLLEGYMALHGRVFLTDPMGQPRIRVEEGQAGMDHMPLADRRRDLLATLAPSEEWSFDLTGTSHARRWRELRGMLLKGELELPSFLEGFLTYITGYGEYQVTNRQELLVEGMDRLAGGRHEAMYRGFGDDAFSYDLLANREVSFDPGLSSKASAYRNLASGFLDFCSEELLGMRQAIDEADWSEARVDTTISLVTPPFEPLTDEVRGEPEINARLGEILAWLAPPSPRPADD